MSNYEEKYSPEELLTERLDLYMNFYVLLLCTKFFRNDFTPSFINNTNRDLEVLGNLIQTINPEITLPRFEDLDLEVELYELDSINFIKDYLKLTDEYDNDPYSPYGILTLLNQLVIIYYRISELTPEPRLDVYNESSIRMSLFNKPLRLLEIIADLINENFGEYEGQISSQYIGELFEDYLNERPPRTNPYLSVLQEAIGCLDANGECPICQEPLDSEEHQFVYQLPCDHCFHQICLDRWMQRAQACPVCRRPFKTRYISVAPSNRVVFFESGI